MSTQIRAGPRAFSGPREVPCEDDQMAGEHRNFINGHWHRSANGETYEHRNPANLTHLTGVYQRSCAQDVSAAVDAATEAFEAWADLPCRRRGEYLRGALELMRQRIAPIAETITRENGKTLRESKAEIASAIGEMEFQIHHGLRLDGQTVPSSTSGVLAYQVRRPIGPVAVIAPWNFPFNVPSRKMTPALMAGNTCVLKPARLTPGTAEQFVKLFEDAGLPSGVVNLVTGPGGITGDALVTDPRIRAVTFTGSTEVGTAIHAKAAAGMKRTQLEMGGKNPLIVLEDADIDAAVEAATLAAFACAGQWCISTSRALVHKAVLDKFLAGMRQRIDRIVLGNGMDEETTMGPVCGEAQLASVLAGIEKAKADGANLLTGGSRALGSRLEKGCFVEPTAFVDVEPGMSVAQEELFGPVLAVMTVDDFENAIDIANGVRYGLGSSIFTRDLARALEFVRRTDVGLTHVNMHTAYKEPQLSFGGVKASGYGIPEAGKTGIEFFTEHKTIYIKGQ